jgi:hypothetical protein
MVDPRGAVRILELGAPPARGAWPRGRALLGFALISALAAHTARPGGFPQSVQAAGMSSAGTETRSRESGHMKVLMMIGVAAALSAGASAQDAVQWRVEDGGNGHWYRIVLIDEGASWTQCRTSAEQMGGYLATVLSPDENQLISAMVGTSGPWFSRNGSAAAHDGPWLGGFRDSLSGEWQWVTGESWSFTAWCSNQPSDIFCTGGELRLSAKRDGYCSDTLNWGDINETGHCPPYCTTMGGMLVEWSADCNADGIVDYGQILAGELADADGNNIPDCCETSSGCCPGDTNLDGAVDGIDLATVLTRWGQSGAKFPDADCNRDGSIDGSDLAIVLGGWGACP